MDRKNLIQNLKNLIKELDTWTDQRFKRVFFKRHIKFRHFSDQNTFIDIFIEEKDIEKD